MQFSPVCFCLVPWIVVTMLVWCLVRFSSPSFVRLVVVFRSVARSLVRSLQASVQHSSHIQLYRKYLVLLNLSSLIAARVYINLCPISIYMYFFTTLMGSVMFWFFIKCCRFMCVITILVDHYVTSLFPNEYYFN